ncbi:TPA: trp operon leader peptide [Escherichia coli]|nr:trp operon leader peptide [Escherichia coli]MCA6692275.1 trp operon leader peptide [Vibrio parahaemolyticus]EFH5759723.1 trp operon leader peptide [Escherichia coli]EFI4482585.1 trp operon leader peptide [Escherichia coli]EFP0881109.1 trp operon leader peptide [Escherichia coli]EGL4402174.1 trp operon leader peptide [Escherichia coli]
MKAIFVLKAWWRTP